MMHEWLSTQGTTSASRLFKRDTTSQLIIQPMPNYCSYQQANPSGSRRMAPTWSSRLLGHQDSSDSDSDSDSSLPALSCQPALPTGMGIPQDWASLVPPSGSALRFRPRSRLSPRAFAHSTCTVHMGGKLAYRRLRCRARKLLPRRLNHGQSWRRKSNI